MCVNSPNTRYTLDTVHIYIYTVYTVPVQWTGNTTISILFINTGYDIEFSEAGTVQSMFNSLSHPMIGYDYKMPPIKG